MHVGMEVNLDKISDSGTLLIFQGSYLIMYFYAECIRYSAI